MVELWMVAKLNETRYSGSKLRTGWLFDDGNKGSRGVASSRSALAPTATGAAVEPVAQV